MLALGSIGYQLYNTSLYQLYNADLIVKVDSVTGYRYCPNDSSFRVYYSTIGSLHANNKFEVEISNNNFQISSYTIGSKITTDATGYIDAYITAGNGYGPPQAITGIPFPNGYEIRVRVYDDNNLRSFGARSATRYGLYPVAAPMFSATASVPSCSNNNNFTFNNQTSPAAISYLWNFGDGTTSGLTNPVKSYTSSGLFPVTLTATNDYGCKSQVTQFVSVNPSDSTTSVIMACGSYDWNGTAYTISGTYYHTYTKVNGCDSVVTLNLTVNTLPIVSFSGLNVTYCSDDASVTLTGSPTGGTFSGPGIVGNSFDPSLAGTGSHSITYNYSNGNCNNTSIQQVTVNTCVTTITLHLKLFLQGYYIDGGIMQPVLNNQAVPNSLAAETDSISVELHDPATFALLDSKKVVLLTDGTISATYTQPAGQYLIAIKHRNTIQTWSADPVQCVAASPLYDFTTAANKAMGDNQAEVEPGIWAFFTGDLNQDDFIDGNDFPAFDTDSFNGLNSEYSSTDMNGDGFVDGNDFPVFDVNSFNGVSAVHP
jgi:PKD repeat protein